MRYSRRILLFVKGLKMTPPKAEACKVNRLQSESINQSDYEEFDEDELDKDELVRSHSDLEEI